MPYLLVGLLAAVIGWKYWSDRNNVLTHRPQPKSLVFGPTGAAIGGAFGAIGEVFPGSRRITRQFGNIATADTQSQVAQGIAASAPVFAGIFRDLGQSMTDSPGGATQNARSSPDSDAVTNGALSPPVFPRDGAGSTVGADQTSNPNAAYDLGMDAGTTGVGPNNYSDPLNPGGIDNTNNVGYSSGVPGGDLTILPPDPGTANLDTSSAPTSPYFDGSIPDDSVGTNIDQSSTDAVQSGELSGGFSTQSNVSQE